MAKLSQNAKATSNQTCPSMSKRWHLLFELVSNWLCPFVPMPSRASLIFQAKDEPFVLAVVTVPGHKARAGTMRGGHPCVRVGTGFGGTLSLWTGRKQNTSQQLGDALWCLYEGSVSA